MTEADDAKAPSSDESAGTQRLCFVVMPYGRDDEEHAHFDGWYHEVIEPAVEASGFRPVLAAAEQKPSAINDEIRDHLARDPMVVADLGGIRPEEPPNPNVMYELGIRHAFDLPHVVMAWKGQRLPFDVANQRVIAEDRRPVDFRGNREKLTRFAEAADRGEYYHPMEAVGRAAKLEGASASLDRGDVLAQLVDEVRATRREIAKLAPAMSTPSLDEYEQLPPTRLVTLRFEEQLAAEKLRKSLAGSLSAPTDPRAVTALMTDVTELRFIQAELTAFRQPVDPESAAILARGEAYMHRYTGEHIPPAEGRSPEPDE